MLAFCLILLLTISVAYSYSIGQVCSTNSDCGGPSNEVHCQKPAYNPPCLKGVCTCVSGYIAVNNSVCIPSKFVEIGSTCNKSAANEIYPFMAYCNSATVTCRGPNYIASGTVCVPATMASFDGFCDPNPTTTNMSKACNATAGMTCNASTNKCVCSNTRSFYKSSAGACMIRTFGDFCGQASDCDTAMYTNRMAQNGGPDCVNDTCGCAADFDKVPRSDYGDGTTVKTIQMCLKGYTWAGFNKTCTMYPETQSNDGALVCTASYVCVRCPEDTAPVTKGTCRRVNSNGAQSRNLNKFAASLTLTIIATMIICPSNLNQLFLSQISNI